MSRNIIDLCNELAIDDWHEFLFEYEFKEETPEPIKQNNIVEKLTNLKEKISDYYNPNLGIKQQEGFDKAVLLMSEMIDNLIWELNNE